MKQQYFIVVVAHSLHGRLRRVHIPHQVLYAVFALALFGLISVVGLASSYVRMAWKVANYNSLRNEISALRSRYQEVQKIATQKDGQLAELQLFASEVSMAYGLKQKLDGPMDISSEGRNLVPTFKQSLEEYDFLRTANLTSYYHRYRRSWQTNVVPALWPAEGRLQSYFGHRVDPFSGEGAVHTGVDIVAPTGTPVHASADGVVLYATWMGGYGRLMVVDHGNGFQTYYAHLSRFAAMPGQEVRQGELIAYIGATGRVTAPHLHYEVRQHGTPRNPSRFMNQQAGRQAVRRDFPF
jgi:murein DD-endopeptidase MepM/ murein hydrolase activator NlpD